MILNKSDCKECVYTAENKLEVRHKIFHTASQWKNLTNLDSLIVKLIVNKRKKRKEEEDFTILVIRITNYSNCINVIYL